MLRRILLTLLIACLAMPAVAMPIAPIAATSDCHGKMPDRDQPDRKASDHGCIGCLAPFRVVSAIDAPEALQPMTVIAALSAQRPHAVAAPEPPPPRV